MATTTLTTEDADAIIDAALLGPNQGKAIPNPDSTGLPPGVGLYTPLDEQAPPPPELTKDQQKIQQAQADMLGKEAAAALAKEQADQRAREQTLIGQAEKLLNKSKAAAGSAGGQIAKLPTPGNLALPLVLLALFFFILLQFNGNTRLQWLWLVVTGNAYVTDTSQTSQAQSTPSTGSGGGPGALIAPDLPFAVLHLPSSNGMYGEAYS